MGGLSDGIVCVVHVLETFMTEPAPSRHDFLRRRANELTDRLERIELDRQRGYGALDADFAEQVVQRENDEVLDSLAESVRTELAEVHHALDRISRGLGKVCEGCGDPISEGRLAAMPQATRCMHCA